MKEPPKIAFLGLGAMGVRMASRLIAAGHDVVVWNRSGVSPSVPALQERAAAEPRLAVKGVDVVFAMLRDDDASRAAWLAPDSGALAASSPGALLVECCTLTPSWTAELAERAGGAGLGFVDAPVVGSRPQADSGSLAFLCGGDARVVDRIRPMLATMGSAVHCVGATPAGAFTKLILNALLGVQVAALAELLAFAGKAGLELGSLMRTLESLPVMSPAAKGAAAGMLSRNFDPLFPVELASKDLRYAVSAAEQVGSSLPVVARVGEIFESGRARELGADNLTAIAKLYD